MDYNTLNSKMENAISHYEKELASIRTSRASVSMLDNIMVYWMNAAGASSARIYWESFGGGLGAEPITTPMGGTDFPREIFRTSEHFAKKFYTGLFYWSVRQSGGHFAAFEQPSVYVEEIQACFRQIR